MNRCLFSLLVLAVSSTVARAHFIWIVPDDKGATAQVIFSDSLQPDAPDLLAKIAKTEVFVRTAEAKTIPLKWTESKEQNSYIISVEGAGDRTLGGVCRYGVIQRGNSEPSFLLNYHAKAFLGWPLEAAAEGKVLQPWDRLPLEIRANKQPGSFQVCWKGKGVANAEVAILAPGQEKAEELKTDPNGNFSVRFAQAGQYGLRARHVEAQEGEHDGKKYKEVRNFSTLVFRVKPDQVEKGSKGKDQLKEDPAATRLLAEARAARAGWSNFPGFSADIEVNLDGQVSKGQVQVDAAGKVLFERLDKAAEAWAKRTLGSIVSHRLDDSADKNTPCAFADTVENHPLGRTIRVLNDELHSGYRIRDRQILEVNRHMPDRRFTISVLENRLNAEGKFLSISFVVNYWNLETGELWKSEANHQSWTRVGKFDLPLTATVVAAAARPKPGAPADGPAERESSTKSFTLSRHKLLEAAGK